MVVCLALTVLGNSPTRRSENVSKGYFATAVRGRNTSLRERVGILVGANKLECYFCALNARESAQRQNLCNKRVPTTSRSIRFFVFNAKLLALRNRSPKHPSPCHRRRLPNVSDSGDTPTPTKAPTPAPYTGESRGRSDMAFILFGCLRCDQLRHPWTRSGQKHDRC